MALEITPVAEPSAHFIVLCYKYPEFSFNVRALRQYRKERDGDPHAKGTVNFQSRLLDTHAQDFDEKEAAIIHAALKKRMSAPLYGVDIVEKGQPAMSDTPTGRFTCGSCTKRYESMEGLTAHYEIVHALKQEQANVKDVKGK